MAPTRLYLVLHGSWGFRPIMFPILDPNDSIVFDVIQIRDRIGRETRTPQPTLFENNHKIASAIQY